MNIELHLLTHVYRSLPMFPVFWLQKVHIYVFFLLGQFSFHTAYFSNIIVMYKFPNDDQYWFLGGSDPILVLDTSCRHDSSIGQCISTCRLFDRTVCFDMQTADEHGIYFKSIVNVIVRAFADDFIFPYLNVDVDLPDLKTIKALIMTRILVEVEYFQDFTKSHHHHFWGNVND